MPPRRRTPGTTATDEQINRALYALDEAGYSTRWMDARFKVLGARMNQRSGRVTAWLAQMTRPEISALIRNLEAAAEPAAPEPTRTAPASGIDMPLFSDA